MIVDTHAHLNFAAFFRDRNKIIKRCLDNNIWMINVGTNYETSKKAVEIAEKYNEGIYSAIGLHPINLETGLIKQKIDQNEGGRFEKEFDFERYEKLGLSSKKIVAIGEIGLDCWYKPKTKKKLAEFKQKQKDLLLEEIKLAKELDLPIIFHCRMAHDDLINLLDNETRTHCGVIHCFTGNCQQAEKYLDMGFYLGFNGIIFKLDLDEIIKKTSLNRILIETDCPFLTPPNFYPEQPFSNLRVVPSEVEGQSRRTKSKDKVEGQSRRIGEERNNPLGVKFVADYIARIKNISLEKIAEITTENAKNLFKI